VHPHRVSRPYRCIPIGSVGHVVGALALVLAERPPSGKHQNRVPAHAIRLASRALRLAACLAFLACLASLALLASLASPPRLLVASLSLCLSLSRCLCLDGQQMNISTYMQQLINSVPRQSKYHHTALHSMCTLTAEHARQCSRRARQIGRQRHRRQKKRV